MKGLTTIILRNTARNPLRGLMTVLAVGVSLLAFLLVRTVNAAWTEQVAQTPNNRVIVRHKTSWGNSLPVHYVQTIRELEGVRRVAAMHWGDLALPGDKLIDIESLAVEPKTFVEMHYELDGPAAEKQAFVEDRKGAWVSAALAGEMGWHVGQQLHFKHPGLLADIVLTIDGIFQSTRRGFAQRAVYYHWEYLNELLPAEEKDRVNLISAEIRDPRDGARLARTIDTLFAGTGDPSFSQEDQALNAQLVGEAGAILDALDVVSLMILGVVMLLLSNTLAMTVRERSKEYGTMRALGFLRSHVMSCVAGEGATLGAVGGSLCLVISYPLVQAVSRHLQASLTFPPLEISWTSVAITMLLGALSGALGGLPVAYRLTRSSTVEALRRIG